MKKKLARKIAQRYIELRLQPLSNKRDFNRNATSFLGETEVDDFEDFDDIDDFDDEIIDDFDDFDDEIIDDLDRMGDFWKESRLPSHKHNDKKTVEKAWKKHKENNPDMEKYEGAMTPDGIDESKVEENTSKSADDFDFIDDMGLGRMASRSKKASQSLVRKVKGELSSTPLSVELESDYDGTDILITWDIDVVYEEDDYDEDYQEDYRGMIEEESLRDLLKSAYKIVDRSHKGFVEHGTSDISEGVYRIRIS